MKALVLGASGFLGRHIVQQLVNEGHDITILVRRTSNIYKLDSLPIQIKYFENDILTVEELSREMEAVDWVFHSIVDTRFYTLNKQALYKTNVDGLKISMNAALGANVKRFIFTSSFSTIACEEGKLADERDFWNWPNAPFYQQTRMEAEQVFFDYCKNKKLPGVACCVANTYGEDDVQATPHGNIIRLMIQNKCPALWHYSIECVGVKDAARAMILAAENGKLGERYIISERYTSMQEIVDKVKGLTDKSFTVRFFPEWIWQCVAYISMFVSKLTRIDIPLHKDMFVFCTVAKAMSHDKATKDLGWEPTSLDQEIAEAVQFFENNPELYT